MSLTSDLSPTEKILWKRVRVQLPEGEYPVLVTRPVRGIWRGIEWGMLLFSLVWCSFFGFAVYVVAVHSDEPHSGNLVSGLLVFSGMLLMGLLLLVSVLMERILFRKRLYVLTNRRAVIQEYRCWRAPVLREFILYPHLVRSVRIRPDGSGDIVFTWDTDDENPQSVTPVGFMDVPHASHVYHAIDARVEQVKKQTASEC